MKAIVEHRSLKKIRRPLNIFNLKMIIGWLIIVAIAPVIARWMGVWASALLVLSAFIALICMHIRFHSRFLIWMVLTTRCPQCGTNPMNYKVSPNCDNHGLLICEKCQIEWDLGQNTGIRGSHFDSREFHQKNLEWLENRIRDGNPPEIRQTVERLTGAGYTADEARQLILKAVTVELFRIADYREAFNKERFVWNLAHLPREPWDEQGRELYRA
jgi:hypothetical protein